MSTYSKFRLWITADNRQFGGGNWFCNIAELDLLNSSGVEISYAGATYSSSGHFSTNAPANAFDANNSSCWSGNANGLPGTPIWLQVDLAAPTDVRSFGIRAFTDTSAPSAFKLQGWDGANWLDIADPGTTYTWTSGQYRTWLFDSGSPTIVAEQQAARETLHAGSGDIKVRQLLRETLRADASPIAERALVRETLRSSSTGTTQLLLRSLIRETLRSSLEPATNNRRRMSLM